MIKTLQTLLYPSNMIKRLIRQFSAPSKLETVKLAYATYGNSGANEDIAAPFIVTHGLFGSKSNWSSLCKAYREKTNPQRKIVAVDARNHGESPHSDTHNYLHMVGDLKELLDDLRIKKAVLMGHSMGGRAVALFALKYSEFVDRLIVVDISTVLTSPTLSEMPGLFEAMDRVQLPKDVPMSQGRAQVDAQLAEKISSESLRAFLMTNLIRNSDGSFKWRINIPGLIQNFKNVARFPDVHGLQYHGPTLFLGGGASDFIPKSDFPNIQKLFPNAELKYIEGAGHWLHSEKPNEFLEITLEFLNRAI